MKKKRNKIGDTIHFNANNQYGDTTHEIILNKKGKKGLKLIKSYDIQERANMEDYYGGKKHSKKNRTKRHKK